MEVLTLASENAGLRVRQRSVRNASLVMILVEARVGIEPTRKGFADLSLTSWVPRLGRTV